MAEDVHDLLVIPSNKKLYRARASTDGFATPTVLDFYDDDYRNVMNIAQVDEAVDPPRGPAFSVLPNKPDPSTSQISCYLVSSQHLRAANPWTTEAWSSEPNPKTTGLTPDPRPRDDAKVALDFLVAGPDGTVSRVQGGAAPKALPNLGEESEIYGQLRNGLVAGSVWCRQANAVLPIINITALFPKEAKVPDGVGVTPVAQGEDHSS